LRGTTISGNFIAVKSVNMYSDRIRIGLAGCGLIGTMHAAALRMCADRLGLPIELASVSDTEPERAKRFQDVFGFRQCADDPLKMAGSKDIDALYVCTWTSEHHPLVSAAASAGVHVFCEKPLAFTAEEAGAMQKEVEDSGVTNQVGLVLRQAPVWNVLREEAKKEGPGFHITTIFRDDQCFPIKGAHPSEWRKDAAKAGRGAIIEHSIHDLDLLEWIFGTVTSVSARMEYRFGHHPVEDLGVVELSFQSGMRASLFSIWHDVLNRHSNRRMEVFREKSYLAVESEFTGPLDIMEKEGEMRTVPEDKVNERFWEIREIEEPELREASTIFGVYQDYLFVKSILDGKGYGPDFGVAKRAHDLVDACYLSDETGSPVEVGPAS